MKIPSKILSIPPNKLIDNTDYRFNALLDFLDNQIFDSTDCNHIEWKAFPSYAQGGRNISDISSLELLREHYSHKISIRVNYSDDDWAIVIFKLTQASN